MTPIGQVPKVSVSTSFCSLELAFVSTSGLKDSFAASDANQDVSSLSVSRCLFCKETEMSTSTPSFPDIPTSALLSRISFLILKGAEIVVVTSCSATTL